MAELILQDEIDVLIDLHGLSAGARPGIFALHPAPLQGTYLGFIGTTGMPWFDFVIADHYALPDELTTYFTEKPLHVQGSFIPVTRDNKPVRVASRHEFGLNKDMFVMAAFGNVYKITPDMFETWLQLLKDIPHAVLWLIDDNATTTRNLKMHARAAGADMSRIAFTPRTSHEEYKAKMAVADVFLDTYPYNCGSTSNDVISVGLTLVTISGRTLVSRMGGSIIQALGMSKHVVTKSHAEYAHAIVKISESRKQVNQLSLRIQPTTSSPGSNITKTIEQFTLRHSSC